MKKYNHTYPCYGQSVAGRIAYYQKMGVAQGISNIVKHVARKKKLNLHDWETKETFNNIEVTLFSMTAIIPTPADYKEIGNFPVFTYFDKRGVIDMINVQDELQFHIMIFDYEKKEFINGYWHTIRESMSLEDTCTLFEYIEDRFDDIIILSPEERGKYNSTGALGVGI